MPSTRTQSTAALLVAGLAGLVTGSTTSAYAEAASPSTACFDVVRTASDETAGAILVNHCSGQTWILLHGRSRHGDQNGYRWSPIAMGGDEAAAAATSAAPAPANPNSSKCFTFQGRKFCE